MRPVNVFVAERGNAFMADIAGWIVEASRLAGRDALLVTDRLPAGEGAIDLVVAPHEFFPLSNASDGELARATDVCVPVCTEQPGTPWFNLTRDIVAGCRIVLDINTHGVDALRALGHEALHLRLGGVPSMVAPTSERDLEFLFLGGTTPRRAARLAELAPLVWDRSYELRLFRFTAPVHGAVPGLAFGADKYRLLARSRVLLNVHRDDVTPGYFEWARMVEAMANGCAVLTEPSAGFAPLVDGEHFVTVPGVDLPGALIQLIDDRDRVRQVGEAARHAVLSQYPLVSTLAPLLDRLDDAPLPAPRRRHRNKPIPRAHRPPLFAALRPLEGIRQRVYGALMDEQRLLRQIERLRCNVLHGSDDVVLRSETDAYAGARPAVSVVVTLYDYAHLVEETLRSIAASTGVEFEIVVVDDHSSDDGRAVVEAFMREHPQLAVRLLASEINRGLSESRNLGVAEARGERIMVMDADNLVFPNCLERLSDALAVRPAAAFAYATLEAFGADPGLRSEMAWFPRWLCEANYIDAQAMIRKSTFDRYGGYRDADDASYGWEDWSLWLRLAAAGEHGVHVPQMLGRYRTQPASMVSITNLAHDAMRARIRGLYPDLPWPEHDEDAV